MNKPIKARKKAVITGAKKRKSAPKKSALKKGELKLIDRELSWLAFNDRVLQEAADTNVPLIERLKFLGIFSNNQDEFFRVRVASIRRLVQLKKAVAPAEVKQLRKTLDKIKETVLIQQDKFNRIYNEEILPELAGQHIHIVNEQQLTDADKKHLLEYFQSELAGRLNPIILKHGRDIPVLKDGAIYLAVRMLNSLTAEVQYALVSVPAKGSFRFHIMHSGTGETRIILLDDIVRLGLPQLFSSLDFDTFTAHTIKITRDAELDIDNEVAVPWMDKVAKSLKQRKTGEPTRFIYDEDIPEDLFGFLTRKLKIDKESAIPGGRYHNFRDFMGFPKVGSAALRNAGIHPKKIEELDQAKSMLDLIEKRDVLLSYPYQSFEYIIRLLREAAIDPGVFAIRISLYRLAENSKIAEALINAVHNEKQVIVVMELRARFMEEHNIYWANRLKDEGAYVIYGIPNYKVHSKLIVISRRKGFETQNVVHIGTGNFNEDTARLYADHALLTSRKRIAAECLKVFDLIQNFKPDKFTFNTLWVSPVNTRGNFLELLKREVINAKKGKPARAIIKVNSLADDISIKAIADAAKAGVKIDLIVRGICCLALDGSIPNIRAVSVVDRYLEHARIFYFENAGKPEVFIGSADLMQRNLQFRVEVTVPVMDTDAKKTLIHVLETQLHDNVKARILEKNMKNDYVARKQGDKPVRSQEALHKIF